MIMSRFLPPVSVKYQGSQIAYYFLVIVAIIGTVRSIIHIIAIGGGADSIAGLAVDVDGGVNLIAIFAQWGVSQLVLAIFFWLAILKYRFLIPFMLSIGLLEQVLRVAVGQLKPIEVVAPPPGAIGSYILFPLSILALILSLRQASSAA